MQKLDLTGQKFNKLTALCPGANKPSVSRGHSTTWECECDCGKIITVRTSELRSLSQKSCGCIFNVQGTKIKPGDKFNKLTAISYKNGKWKCKCDCGKIVNGKLTHRLTSGKLLSCGCARLSRKTREKVNRKYSPMIASARRRWKSYLYQDKQCNLTFEQWHEISQKNCVYCGCEPKSIYNYFIKKEGSSSEAKASGDFKSNGLDRVDSSKPHVIDNVVACCITCNKAKSNRTVEEFKKYILTLKIGIEVRVPEAIDLPLGYILTSIKDAYRHYARNYGEMELTLEEFYEYSQMPCVYCGAEKVNCLNTYLCDEKMSIAGRDAAYFHYNGIDRVDSKLRHTADNVVPCCKYCNFGKSNLTLEEFNDWINRIQAYQRSINNIAS